MANRSCPRDIHRDRRYNPVVAAKVCHDLGHTDAGVLAGVDIDHLDDTGLTAAIVSTTVFARVSPEHKARIVGIQRRTGGDVAILGDGVNDAMALHAADAGISVDSATDVACCPVLAGPPDRVWHGSCGGTATDSSWQAAATPPRRTQDDAAERARRPGKG